MKPFGSKLIVAVVSSVQAFVAREPIFDRKLKVVGYGLSFSDGSETWREHGRGGIDA